MDSNDNPYAVAEYTITVPKVLKSYSVNGEGIEYEIEMFGKVSEKAMVYFARYDTAGMGKRLTAVKIAQGKNRLDGTADLSGGIGSEYSMFILDENLSPIE